MKRLITAACLSMIATQGTALSCMRPDVARTFQWAAVAEDPYVILRGTFDFDAPAQLRGPVIGSEPEEQRFAARFSGLGLGLDGFSPSAVDEVTVVFSCMGPWCGYVRPGEDMLAFVKLGPRGYELSVDPCYNMIFVDPSEQDLARALSCMRGEACKEAPLR